MSLEVTPEELTMGIWDLILDNPTALRSEPSWQIERTITKEYMVPEGVFFSPWNGFGPGV